MQQFLSASGLVGFDTYEAESSAHKKFWFQNSNPNQKVGKMQKKKCAKIAARKNVQM